MLLKLYKYYLYQSRFISFGALLAASIYSLLILEMEVTTTVLIISAFVTSYYISQTHACHKALLMLPLSRNKTILADYLALISNLLISNSVFLLIFYCLKFMLNNPKLHSPLSYLLINIGASITVSLIAKSCHDYFRKFGGIGHIVTIIIAILLFFGLVIASLYVVKLASPLFIYLNYAIYLFLIFALFLVTKSYFARLDF